MSTAINMDFLRELSQARDRLIRAEGCAEQADRAVEAARAAARRAHEALAESRDWVARLERESATGESRHPLIDAIESASASGRNGTADGAAARGAESAAAHPPPRTAAPPPGVKRGSTAQGGEEDGEAPPALSRSGNAIMAASIAWRATPLADVIDRADVDLLVDDCEIDTVGELVDVAMGHQTRSIPYVLESFAFSPVETDRVVRCLADWRKTRGLTDADGFPASVLEPLSEEDRPAAGGGLADLAADLTADKERIFCGPDCDSPRDREVQAMIRDYRRRQESGDVEPRWERWSEMTIPVPIGVSGNAFLVFRVLYEPRNGWRSGHFDFHGGGFGSEEQYRSHLIDADRRGGMTLLEYATRACRHLAVMAGLECPELDGAPEWRSRPVADRFDAKTAKSLAKAGLATLGAVDDESVVFRGQIACSGGTRPAVDHSTFARAAKAVAEIAADWDRLRDAGTKLGHAGESFARGLADAIESDGPRDAKAALWCAIRLPEVNNDLVALKKAGATDAEILDVLRRWSTHRELPGPLKAAAGVMMWGVAGGATPKFFAGDKARGWPGGPATLVAVTLAGAVRKAMGIPKPKPPKDSRAVGFYAKEIGVPPAPGNGRKKPTAKEARASFAEPPDPAVAESRPDGPEPGNGRPKKAARDRRRRPLAWVEEPSGGWRGHTMYRAAQRIAGKTERGAVLLTETAEIVLCNRCNAMRHRTAGKCPQCRCPEYRTYQVAAREIDARRGAEPEPAEVPS